MKKDHMLVVIIRILHIHISYLIVKQNWLEIARTLTTSSLLHRISSA